MERRRGEDEGDVVSGEEGFEGGGEGGDLAEEGGVGEVAGGGGVDQERGGGEGRGGGGGGGVEEGEGVLEDGEGLRRRRERDGGAEAVVGFGLLAEAILGIEGDCFRHGNELDKGVGVRVMGLYCG